MTPGSEPISRKIENLMRQRESVLQGAIVEMLELEVALDRALRDQIDDFDAEHPDIVHHLKYIATFVSAHIAQLRARPAASGARD